jgi:hypothetical protein
LDPAGNEQGVSKMTITTKFFLVFMPALMIAVPAAAQRPDWSQRGDYYAPDKTIVQHPTPGELRQERESDYYSPQRTMEHQPMPGELNQGRDGDYYTPTNGN